MNPATKNVQKKVVPVSAPKPSKTMTSAAPSALETFKYKHTPEEAELMATEMIPSQIVTDLVDANWKVRLAALDEMTAWTDTNADVLDAEVIVRALAKKGWNEKNFQVLCKKFSANYSLTFPPGVGKIVWHSCSISREVPFVWEILRCFMRRSFAG